MDARTVVKDGRVAIQRLRSDPATTAIPVIAVTASVHEFSGEADPGHAFDGLLPKSVKVKSQRLTPASALC